MSYISDAAQYWQLPNRIMKMEIKYLSREFAVSGLSLSQTQSQTITNISPLLINKDI